LLLFLLLVFLSL
jgi:hypothetical protein